MKHKGGKQIAYGSYGCVFKPPIKCKGEDYRRKGISKLMKKGEAHEEISEQEKVDKIDPNFEYHLKPPHMCGVGEYDSQTDEKMSNCGIHKDDIRKIVNLDLHKHEEYGKRDNHLILLQMENGGRDLDDYIHNKLIHKLPDEKKKFICGMKNLFKGLVDFKKNDFYHLDIKGANILYNEDTNRFNYIDFGLSADADTILNTRDFLFSYGYFFHPPYMNMLNGLGGLTKRNLEDFTSDVQQIMRGNDGYTKQFDKEFILPVGQSIRPSNSEIKNDLQKIAKEKQSFILETMKSDSDPPKSFIKEYASKIDIYSLGTILVKIYRFCTGKKIDLSKVDESVEPFYIELQNLIKGMIKKNYIDRITPENAYKKMVSICKRYGVDTEDDTTSSSGAAASASGSNPTGGRGKKRGKSHKKRSHKRDKKKHHVKKSNKRHHKPIHKKHSSKKRNRKHSKKHHSRRHKK
tara:strand:+ start:1779 stop:3161 length:1383 start_codon:yes stop_codon:yes gene_type:complete